MKKTAAIGAVFALPLAIALTGCGSQEEMVYTCVMQETPDGDYVVLAPEDCDNDGNNYASSHSGVYPWFFYHSSTTYYEPGSRVAPSAVAAGSIARANDAIGKTNAQASVTKATGLKVGTNGVARGTKGGFGFSGGRGGSVGG